MGEFFLSHTVLQKCDADWALGRNENKSLERGQENEMENKEKKKNAKVICWCQDFLHSFVAFFSLFTLFRFRVILYAF